MYLDLNWSANFVIVTTYNANQCAIFSITDTKFYVSIVTLSTQDNAKLLAQIKSGFKRTINCNFVSSFENNAKRVSYNRYFYPAIEIKDYNIMIDRKNFSDQLVKNDFRTYDSIRKIAASQGDDYRISCFLDYNHFKNYYRMIATSTWCWSKSNSTNQFYWKFRSRWKHNNVFHYWRSKRNYFRFFARNCGSIVNFVIRLSYCVFHNLFLL